MFFPHLLPMQLSLGACQSKHTLDHEEDSTMLPINPSEGGARSLLDSSRRNRTKFGNRAHQSRHRSTCRVQCREVCLKIGHLSETPPDIHTRRLHIKTRDIVGNCCNRLLCTKVVDNVNLRRHRHRHRIIWPCSQWTAGAK